MKINRMNIFTFITMIFILLFVTTACASEEQLEWKEGWPTRINIGAAPIGGGFYMGASSLANVLKEEWPRLEVIVEQTKASIHNIRLTEADEVHFIVGQAVNPAHQNPELPHQLGLRLNVVREVAGELKKRGLEVTIETV